MQILQISKNKQFNIMKMKTLKIILFTACLVLTAEGCAQKKDFPQGVTAAQVDSLSYSLGVMMGMNFKQSKLTYLDMSAYNKAVEDVLADKTLKIDMMAAQMFLQSYFMKMQEIEQREMEQEAIKNLEEGQKFLEGNKTKEGVIETSSGLQYKIVIEGNGPIATAVDSVEVHYTGTLIDGTKFDSSLDRGETFTCAISGGVIQGWLEGLQLVPEGSKVIFYIPSELAYGPQARGPQLPANSTLIFEIDVIKVKKGVEKK